MTELKDWLNSINFTKDNLMKEDETSKKIMHLISLINVCPHILSAFFLQMK